MKLKLSTLCLVLILLIPQSLRAADENFFTIAVMPDTQYYTEMAWKNDQYFKGQTRWIVENQKKEHIVFVSHVGDLQQDGTFLRLNKQPDPEQAELVAKSTPEHPAENTIQ